MTDAQAILTGTSTPWQSDSRIATREEWISAAQCALDGDPADLDLYLAQLNGEIEIPDEPPRWDSCVAFMERIRRASQPINIGKAA